MELLDLDFISEAEIPSFHNNNNRNNNNGQIKIIKSGANSFSGLKDAPKTLDKNKNKIQIEPEENPNPNGNLSAILHDEGEVSPLSAFQFDRQRRYLKEDLKYNFLAIKWAAWLKMSPFGVDNNNSSKNAPRLRAGYQKLWEKSISFGWYFVAWIRLLILIFSTAHLALTNDGENELGRMTLLIAGSTAVTLVMCNCTLYRRFKGPDISTLLCSIFKYLDDESEEMVDEKLNRSWKFHTPKELLIIHLPFLIYSAVGMMPLLSIVDPSFPLLLVSFLPAQSQFSLPFFTLAIFDSMVISFYFMMCHTVFYMFYGLHRIQEEAQLTIKNMKKIPTDGDRMEQDEKIPKALKMIHLLHIWTQFYNISFSTIVYMTKLIALSASIFGGFGLIKMLDVENFPYAGILGLLFLDGTIVYNLSFGQAYEIPEKVEEVKREIRKMSFKNQMKGNSNKTAGNPEEIQRKYIDKYLRSIPWLGVKDGVYKMGRMTCVNYLDFAVQQIISLVLAY